MEHFIRKLVDKYPNILNIATRIKWIRHLISNLYINGFANSVDPRPRPFSLAAPYTTWTALTDRTYTGRHLPECDGTDSLPDIKKVTELWRRKDDIEIPSTDTSMLFSFFAQWFTDSFLRTDLRDRRKNTSNHEIDFCQLYGLREEVTDALRLKEDGKLKYQIIDGQVYPPYLFVSEKTTKDNWVFASPEFEKMHPLSALEFIFQDAPEEKLKYMFAVGLEHGNSVVGYTVLVTIMLREHNRICDELKLAHPDWDDERLFQTTRNIMIVCLLNIVIKDYIRHISPYDFKLDPSPEMAEKQNWYRSNRITLEFDLLYRWHSMVPEKFKIGTKVYPLSEIRNNPQMMTKYGVGAIITAASKQKAGRIGLSNTPQFFFDPMPVGPDDRSVMERTVEMSRTAKLQSYNNYCDAFNIPRLNSFEELTDDPVLLSELKQLYNNNIDNLEWLVGIFAEKHENHSMLGRLMTTMVAYDAFTHALTNPLLSKYVFNEKTFSKTGMAIIKNTNTLDEIVQRNVTEEEPVIADFTLDKPIAPPGSYGLPVFGVIYDTCDFLFKSGWTEFFLKRQAKYKSSVYKANLFMKTIVVLDHQGFDPLFNWDGRLKKDYGFGWAIPPMALVGNEIPSVFLSNPEHQKYKSLYVEILKSQANTFESTFTNVFDDYSKRWLKMDEFSMTDELERMSASFVFQWYFKGQVDADKVRYVYSNIFAHKPLWLLKLLPWSIYSRSIPLFNELLSFVKSSDGIGAHIELAKRFGLNDSEAVSKQLLFLTGMNNFLGLQGFSKALVGELSLRPDLRKELIEEMSEVENFDTTKLDLSILRKLPKLNNTLKEVMRLHPPVFFIYGRAAKDFSLKAKTGIYAISKGDHLMGAIPIAHLDGDVFSDPKQFRPQRFENPEMLEHLIWPHGKHNAAVSTSGHICPGKSVAIEFGLALSFSLLMNFDWELQEKPTWSDKTFTLNVASPTGPMQTKRFERRT